MVRMHLCSHLRHVKAFGNAKQDAPWLEKQKLIPKSNFELDQKIERMKLLESKLRSKMRGWKLQRTEKQWLKLQIGLPLALK